MHFGIGFINLKILSEDYIYAGITDCYLILSSDNGNSWISKNGDVQFNQFNGITGFATIGNNIFAATSNGIYRAKLSEITSIEEKPTENISIQVYPNPAEDNLTVSINNNNQTNKIEVNDLLGNKLKEYETPEQTATINIESLSKGVYFLKIGNEIKMFVKE